MVSVYDVAKASAVTALATDVATAVSKSDEAFDLANGFQSLIDGLESKVTGIVNVADFATPGQLVGIEDAAPAWYAAIDEIRILGGGMIISPPTANWWWSGVGIAYLSTSTKDPIHDVVFEGNGCRMFKDSQDGNYVMFLDRYSRRPAGASSYSGVPASEIWGSGSMNITFRNFNVYGSLKDGAAEASVCFFAGNHTSGLLIEHCTFNHCMAGGHTIDIAGVQDATFQYLRWYGYKPEAGSGTAPRGEAINTDCSLNGSGAAAAGWASGLACRRIKLLHSEFHPYTDPDTGTKYPGPNPIGAHGASEGSPFQDITVDDVLVVDPADDGSASTGIGGNDPYIRGIFHWTAIQGLFLRARVIATSGTCNHRVVQIQSSSEGNQAGTADAPVVGPFAAPMQLKDVTIDLEVRGFAPTTGSTFNPLVYVGGLTTQKAKDVKVRCSADGNYRDGVYLWHVNGGQVDLPDFTCNALGSAARLPFCTNLVVRGNVKGGDFGVRVEDSQYVSIALTATRTAGGGTCVVRTGGTSDYISVNGVAKGYAANFNIVPTNKNDTGLLRVA